MDPQTISHNWIVFGISWKSSNLRDVPRFRLRLDWKARAADVVSRWGAIHTEVLSVIKSGNCYEIFLGNIFHFRDWAKVMVRSVVLKVPSSESGALVKSIPFKSEVWNRGWHRTRPRVSPPVRAPVDVRPWALIIILKIIHQTLLWVYKICFRISGPGYQGVIVKICIPVKGSVQWRTVGCIVILRLYTQLPFVSAMFYSESLRSNVGN